jgi:hypothetical protein
MKEESKAEAARNFMAKRGEKKSQGCGRGMNAIARQHPDLLYAP